MKQMSYCRSEVQNCTVIATKHIASSAHCATASACPTKTLNICFGPTVCLPPRVVLTKILVEHLKAMSEAVLPIKANEKISSLSEDKGINEISQDL